MIIAFLTLPVFGFSQTGYEFWFAPPEVTHEFTKFSPYTGTDLDRPIKLIFSTSDSVAHVTVTQPANPLFLPITATVLKDSLKQVDLTPFIDEIETRPADTVLNTGLKITSDHPINANYEVQDSINSETFTLKGKNGMGLNFIIPGQDLYPNHEYCDPPARNSFTIVATDDSTVVHIVPSAEIEGHSTTDTFAILLNRGQTFCVRAQYGDSLHHLGGSWAFSNKPICITVADDAIIPTNYTYVGNPVDLTGDQVIPEEIAGTDFFAPAAIEGGNGWVFIYAYYDTTDIYMSGTFMATLNRGQFTRLLCAFNNGVYVRYIHSSKPVSVYELNINGATSLAPPYCSQGAACVVPPSDCGGSHRVTTGQTGPFTTSGSEFYQTVVTQTVNAGNITIYYPPPMPPFTAPAWVYSVIPGTNNDWWEVSFGYGGANLVSCIIDCPTGKFHIWTTYNNDKNFCRLSYFSDFSSLNLGPDREICQGDSVILDAGFGKDSYLWNTGDTTPMIVVRNAGIYWVQTVDDTCTLSDTIHISLYIPPPFSWVLTSRSATETAPCSTPAPERPGIFGAREQHHRPSGSVVPAIIGSR